MAISYEKSKPLKESFLTVARLYEKYAVLMTKAAAVAVELAQAMDEHSKRLKELESDLRQQTPD